MLKLFYSYSSIDAKWRAKLSAHLSSLEPKLLAPGWYDRLVSPGRRWDGEISTHLNDADIIVLLVSADFIKSEYCAAEAERAMERQSAGEAVVVPVMLSHCNLSQSAFEHLQTVPPQDKPIKSWRDKEGALKEVSIKIERLASNITGTRAKQKFLSRSYPELANLLHLLCDRSPQRDSLRGALHPLNRKEGRPFVVIVRGAPHDALDRFMRRLREVLLPRLLGEKPGLLSPLSWPDVYSVQLPFDLFASRLEEVFPVRPFATQEEMNASIKTLSSVSLLPSFVAADTLPKDKSRMIDVWVRLWESWPKLPAERMLIPVLAIESPPEDEHAENDILWFGGHSFAGVALPPLEPVRHSDFKDWLREDQVKSRFDSPEHAIERAGRIAQIFPVAMLPLADSHLPRFLELL
jgi:hypothetical protein